MGLSFRYYARGFWKYSQEGFRDPWLAWHYLIYGNRKATRLQVKRVAETLGYQAKDLEQYYTYPELRQLQLHISEALRGTHFSGVGAAGEDFYVMLRMLTPEIVVETGVASGVSTAFILKALEDNNQGTLYSIDYPWRELDEEFPFPEGKEPGFVIPEYLRRRWILKVGKSKDILPNLLNELGRVDVFLHDSEHTYENMMFEYSTAWGYLSRGGLLLSHDTDWNSAFSDFHKKAGGKSFALYFRGGVGAIIK